MGNAQIATLAVGVVGVSAGGNLFWSLVAIVTGVLIGTFFTASHSAHSFISVAKSKWWMPGPSTCRKSSL